MAEVSDPKVSLESIQLTFAQIAMLRKMASENVWASPGRGTIRVLQAKGLIEMRRSPSEPFSNQYLWRLTNNGRAWVRANPEEQQ